MIAKFGGSVRILDQISWLYIWNLPRISKSGLFPLRQRFHSAIQPHCRPQNGLCRRPKETEIKSSSASRGSSSLNMSKKTRRREQIE